MDQRDDPIAASGLTDHLGFMVRWAQVVIFRDFIAQMSSLDLRPITYSVLLMIDGTPGLTQTAVSEPLGIKRTNFVPILDELVARGLVERRPAPRDRRSHALYLTPAGGALLTQAKALAAAQDRGYAERLPPGGRAQLLELLHRLVGTDRIAGPAPANPETPQSRKPGSARI